MITVVENSLLELAARCERAEGPDRGLDAVIHIALGLSDGNPIADRYGWCLGSQSNPNPVESPAYTASLDAAMTLALEGRRIDTIWNNAPEPERVYIANPHVKSAAATPALALTAACLRARASKQDTPDAS